HPEATHECRELADAVLSTGGMCAHVAASGATEFIIATETGILHTLRKNNLGKLFYAVAEGVICPDMKRVTLLSIRNALAGRGGEAVTVVGKTAAKALRSLERMLALGG
ncbi:MAG: quinolinate synthase NadA, partial [Chitinispirillaceae bacterium]|nr:quinolinate synthase NadA [Chitinispirillaceae bacterium]